MIESCEETNFEQDIDISKPAKQGWTPLGLGVVVLLIAGILLVGIAKLCME